MGTNERGSFVSGVDRGTHHWRLRAFRPGVLFDPCDPPGRRYRDHCRSVPKQPPCHAVNLAVGKSSLASYDYWYCSQPSTSMGWRPLIRSEPLDERGVGNRRTSIADLLRSKQQCFDYFHTSSHRRCYFVTLASAELFLVRRRESDFTGCSKRGSLQASGTGYTAGNGDSTLHIHPLFSAVVPEPVVCAAVPCRSAQLRQPNLLGDARPTIGWALVRLTRVDFRPLAGRSMPGKTIDFVRSSLAGCTMLVHQALSFGVQHMVYHDDYAQFAIWRQNRTPDPALRGRDYSSRTSWTPLDGLQSSAESALIAGPASASRPPGSDR